MVLHLAQGQLIPHARFALAERVDPATNRRYALTHIEVAALDAGGGDRPALSCQDLFEGQLRTADHAVGDADEASAPVRFHHLRVAQHGQRYPPRLGYGASLLAPFGLHPMTKMGQ